MCDHGGHHLAKKLFQVVRDIPYRVSGDRTLSAVVTRGYGSCSGKHLLLGKLMETVGFEVRYAMVRSRVNDMRVHFPAAIQTLLDEREVFDYHNFLNVNLGVWCRVDATFDMAVADTGVVVNAEWTPGEDCKLAFPEGGPVIEVQDLAHEKAEAVASLTEEQRQDRELFFKYLSEWFETFRTRPTA